MAMIILRRVVSGIVLLLVISVLAHVMLLPGVDNVARNILGEAASDEQVVAKAQALGLDRPFIERYVTWLTDAVSGDLGTSYYSAQSVSDALAFRVPVTLSLIVLVTACTAVVAFTTGMVAAVRRGWIDRALQVLTTLGDALPAFLIGLFLVTLFAIQLGWFPATGYVPLANSPAGWIRSLTLPVIALTVTSVVAVAQHVRSATIGVLRSDYVRTLRSRGLSRRYVLLTSVLRNSATTGLAALAVQITAILGGAVVIEQVFALPGLGFLAVQSAIRSDLPVTIGVLMTFVLIVVVVNLLVDVLVAWLNPKVRMTS
jgi:peptide/nickel transport system permease protein